MLAGRIVIAFASLLASGCSFVGVETRHEVAPPGGTVHCTDSFWLPAADLAAIAGLAVGAVFVSEYNRDEIDEAHERGEYDAQDGIAILMPYYLAAHLAVPFGISSIRGTRRVRECREAKLWAAETRIPVDAGRIGAACVPVYDGPDHCEQGATCRAGRCVGVVAQTAPPLTRADCALAIAPLHAARTAQSRLAAWTALPGDCKALLRSGCARSIAAWRTADAPAWRRQLEAEMSPACRQVLAES
jgi:hypothetical protein